MKEKSILEKWRSRKKNLANRPKGIQKRPENIQIPLSFGQERLWFMQQLYPDNPFYHYAETYWLKGQLQRNALQQAFDYLVNRYEILRTNFQLQDGRPIQIVQPNVDIRIEQIDLSQVAENERNAQLEAASVAAAKQPFDLQKDPLFRIQLFQLSETVHVLLLTMHHIITDKWSMNVLRQELVDCYNQLSQGTPVHLSALPYQFADFAYWQRQQKQDEKHLNYWTTKLGGKLPILELPYDFPRPAVNSFEGSYHEQNLPLELCAPIRNLSKDFGVTLYVFMLAAYKIMLQKYTDTYDVIVGSPISNRDQSSLEQQIGFFNETIALRTKLKADSSFKAIVAQLNQTTVEAFQHKNTPFEQIVKAVNPDRAQVVNPIFQVMFILHHVPKTPEFEGDLQLVHEPFDFGVCKFDLTLYVSDEGEQLRTLFEYAHDVFAVDTIARMQGYYQHILAQIVQNPEIKLADIELITPKEKQQIAYDWNDTALPLADVPHLPALLERMAVQYPDRKAVSDSKHSITYRVLNERANTIAHRLLENGLEANQIVGLLAERSVEMLVGIWGILKAGGAYLPIDPDYPKARTKFLLEDANLSIILTQAALKDSLPDDIQKLIVLDEADNKVGSAKQVAVNIQKDQLAYMIYTSGSTGKPKGVAISHANLIHSTLARQHYYPQSPTAFLLLSSFAFDSSVAGIFWTLCTGGHLVLPPKRIEQDVEALGDLIAKHQVTHTLLLPSLYNAVLNYIATAQLASLQTVVVAGEACTRALSHLHYQQLPNAKLYNEYGPTEASVWCTVHELQPEVTDRSVPIGRPIPNAKAYILNPQMQAMPVGVVGELYIGGLGIAQGYWQRAALTTERFLPNPFGTSATEKIYKTGDLARYRSDGTIDFLGRKDRQVKVRGYRIELEEVRHAIEQQSEVEAAVVIIHQPETGENTQKNASLVAFVQAANDLNVSDLRDHLKDHLPNYMIPANFQLVDVFPKLPNGKIDVNALTEAYQATDNQTDQYEKPTSELEQALVDIWESVLKQQPIGVNDNFFEIGGDSILSIQIIARARKAGIVLASNAIFEHQSIAELSLFAQFKTAEKTNNELLRGESPLLPIQQWFFETHQNAPAHWNQAFRFDLPQQLAVEKVEATARLLIQQHDALRLRFVQENHQWTSYFNELEKAAVFQLYDGTSLDIFGREKQLAHELRALQQEFDLSQGNLFKVCYFKNGASQRDQLVFLAHHLVVDAISWQVIVEDFSNIYEQLDKEQTVQLGSKTESYQAWGNTLKTWAANGKFQAELDYWQQQKSLALPTDMEATAPITEATTRTLTLELDEAHTTQLLSDIHEAYNTKVEEILIAALVLSLQQKYQLSSVTFGLERHGREALDETFDFSESVGWFTTQFPLTITTSLAMDLGDLIKTVKEQIRAVPNKGLGYGVLRYLSKSTELNQALPLNFNYLGQVAAVEDQLLGKAQFLTQQVRAVESERPSVWEINASIQTGKLHLHWTYSKQLHREASIHGLLAILEEQLKAIIAHCLQAEETAYTPSDFPEVNLNQDELDHLLGELL